MLTLRGWAVLGAGIAILGVWYIVGEPDLLLIGIFLLLAVLVSPLFLWGTSGNSVQVSISRQIGSGAIHEGDNVTVNLTLANKRPLPVRHLRFHDRIEILGYAHFEVGSLRRGETATAAYRIECKPRGVYRVGPIRGSVYDPLGLFAIPIPEGHIDRLVVYPVVEPLADFDLGRGKDLTTDSIQPQHQHGGGDDFYTLREYQRGDEMRRVHWPSSARIGELVVRQFETPRQARALVILDPREEVYESANSFETAVSGAASVYTHFVGQGFMTELWTGGSRLTDTASYEATMERLAVIDMESDVTFGNTINRLRNRGSGGAMALVTGVADHEALGTYDLLAPDYARTVLMSVSGSIPQTITSFQRRGALTVLVPPGSTWKHAWHKTMKDSWDVASAR